jgi:hypothetical protein
MGNREGRRKLRHAQEVIWKRIILRSLGMQLKEK